MNLVKKLAKEARIEWLILQVVVEAEVKAGPSDALDVQMARFEEAFEALEEALQAA